MAQKQRLYGKWNCNTNLSIIHWVRFVCNFDLMLIISFYFCTDNKIKIVIVKESENFGLIDFEIESQDSRNHMSPA